MTHFDVLVVILLQDLQVCGDVNLRCKEQEGLDEQVRVPTESPRWV